MIASIPADTEASRPAPCPGCGAVVGPSRGPTHAYIAASPGCWARFAELSVEGVALPGLRQMATDAYAAQHPGVPDRRSIQSVCVHLVSLCAALERGWPGARGPELLRRAVADPPEWRRLDAPAPIGSVTVLDVCAAASAPDRGRRVRHWAEDVWGAYGAHHDIVREWLDLVLTAGRRQ